MIGWFLIFYSLRQQASELHRRKAVESSQSATDLKLHLDKYHAQLKDAQNAVANNTSGMHQEVCKYKRVQVNIDGQQCIKKEKCIMF